MKVTVLPIVVGALGTVTKGLVKSIRGLRNKRSSGDHPNYSIVEIDQNTEKSPGDSRRLIVTKTQSEIPSANADVRNSQGIK